MAKRAPQNLPVIGDYVRLRGHIPVGVLRHIGPENGWCRVDWDAAVRGPTFCHLRELEIIGSITDRTGQITESISDGGGEATRDA